jgi:hypothetical protein
MRKEEFEVWLLTFPELFYCGTHTSKLTTYWKGHIKSTPLEQLCTQPNDAASVGNIF